MIKYSMDEFLKEFNEAFERVKKLKVQSRAIIKDWDDEVVRLYNPSIIAEPFIIEKDFSGMNKAIADGIEKIGYFAFEDCFSWAGKCIMAGAISAATQLYKYAFDNAGQDMIDRYYESELRYAIELANDVEHFRYNRIIDIIRMTDYAFDQYKKFASSTFLKEPVIEPEDLDCWLSIEERKIIIQKRKNM